jgi:hypothetical protein
VCGLIRLTPAPNLCRLSRKRRLPDAPPVGSWALCGGEGKPSMLAQEGSWVARWIR